MKIYYMQNLELGWDNVVSIALTRQKCIEEYTDGDIVLKTEEEVDEFLTQNKYLHIDYKLTTFDKGLRKT